MSGKGGAVFVPPFLLAGQISQGLDKASDMPEFEKIWLSPKSIRILYDMEQAEESKKAKEGKPHSRRPKPVRCIDNGMEFPSINKAAEYFGIKLTRDVSDCCYGVYTSVYGHQFEFIEGN